MNNDIAIPQPSQKSYGQISPARRFPLNVSNIERVASAAGGAYILTNAILKRNLTFTKAISAGLLLLRGISGHCPVYDALGKREPGFHAKNVNIKTTLPINRARHEVYGFWRRLENLPRYMRHLESVKIIDENISEWKAKIPGGLGTVTWRSEIVKDEPGATLSWKSLPGSVIENAGKIEFSDAGKWGTNVHVVITYHAPLGIVGEAAARLLNPMFEKIVKEDVINLKHYIEAGAKYEELRGAPEVASDFYPSF
jgi:uncharacterized membrane protein